MTTEKMPDVIWADIDSVLKSIGDWSYTKSECYETKYLRAEPVEELMKQARDIVDCYNAEYNTCDDLLTAIEKFLGNDK